MRNRPFIVRCTAFFLLIVFSQKAGAGLLLHNLFHDNVVNNKNHNQEHKDQKEIAYNCACVDDLLMPFAGTDETFFLGPVLVFSAPATFFEEPIPFYPSIFSLLRGPPAFTL
jgi:hypothetical protein